MTFGSQTDIDTVRWSTCALDRGANFCDTANLYSGGRSEEVLGEVLGDRAAGSRPRLGGWGPTISTSIIYIFPTMT